MGYNIVIDGRREGTFFAVLGVDELSINKQL